MAGKIENADFLANTGADAECHDEQGRNALHWAVVCGQVREKVCRTENAETISARLIELGNQQERRS